MAALRYAFSSRSVGVAISSGQLQDVRDKLSGVKGALPRALTGAVNDTARQQLTWVNRKIREKIRVRKRDLDKYMKARRAKVSPKPVATVEIAKRASAVSETLRLPLKYFGAKQTKRGGVSYRIATGGSRERIPSAFIVAKAGGHVFARAGATRLPIIKLFGISPYGVFLKGNMKQPTRDQTRLVLAEKVRQRLRLEVLRMQGRVKQARAASDG